MIALSFRIPVRRRVHAPVRLGVFASRGRRLLTACSLLLLTACARDGGPIVIGIAGPMTQTLGASMQRAARLAVEQINARGGVRGGRLLQLRIMDDSGGEDGAVHVAQALYDDPRVVAVAGHISSGPTLAAARVYSAGTHPVPMVSPTASSPDLSGLSPYVFRVCPSDLSHGPALARYARQALGARRAGIIFSNEDYGRGVRQTFATEFTKLGGVVIEQDPHLPNTTSLEPYLMRMRQRGGVDVLMLATDQPGAELALRDLGRTGIHWPVIGADALVGIEADGSLAEGMHLSSAYLADRPGDVNAAFVAAYGRAYQGLRPDDVAGLTYDILNLLAQAINAAGPDRMAIRDYLAGVQANRGYEGVTGRIAFDSQGDVPGKPVTIARVHGGQLVAEGSQ